MLDPHDEYLGTKTHAIDWRAWRNLELCAIGPSDWCLNFDTAGCDMLTIKTLDDQWLLRLLM